MSQIEGEWVASILHDPIVDGGMGDPQHDPIVDG